MIAIVALILLIVRYSRFSRLARATDAEELRQARRYSGMALNIYIVFAALSFVPAFIQSLVSSAYGISVGLSLGGLLIAAAFDFKAERLKRRAAIPKESEKALLKKGKELQKADEMPQKLYLEATKAERQGIVDEAIAKYRTIIEQYPETDAAKDAKISLNVLAQSRNA